VIVVGNAKDVVNVTVSTVFFAAFGVVIWEEEAEK
jgi:hypothetical protein